MVLNYIEILCGRYNVLAWKKFGKGLARKNQ